MSAVGVNEAIKRLPPEAQRQGLGFLERQHTDRRAVADEVRYAAEAAFERAAAQGGAEPGSLFRSLPR